MLHKETVEPGTLELIEKLQADSIFKGFYLVGGTALAAMKVNAITGNGTRVKDFIDIYFLLKANSFEEIIHYYSVKYDERNTFHVLKSLTYFNDIEEGEWPKMIIEPQLNLEEVKSFIIKKRDEYLRRK